jgi:D-alanyl-D-alanine carboxypeptidase/D-alanyl-D-alanine-endopeptidase (penicillin-binding protein 4)
MKRPVPARAVVAALLVALAVPAAAGSTPRASLQQRLAQALRVVHVSPAASGAVVVDLATGRTVFATNPTLPLLPASNEKLAVTYAALTALGPAFRIETDVLGRGAQDGSVWHGDLVLKGYGDPTLSRADLVSLARQVAAAGIARVTGGVVGDESWFDAYRTAPGWKSTFYLTESPPLSALIVDRGWNGYREERKPALAAAQLFRKALSRAGVRVAGPARVGTAAEDDQLLADVESAPVAALVRFMDRNSDNFTAEMLLKEVGAVHRHHGTTAAGLRVTAGLLRAAGVPMRGVRMVDGSGLSLLDRWTPTAIVALLRAMWEDPGVRPELLHALPVAGENGTLVHRMRTGPARGVVRAKTGSTDNASALSGFVGDRYAFSVLENGWPVWTTSAEASQDSFAGVLAASGLGLSG